VKVGFRIWDLGFGEKAKANIEASQQSHRKLIVSPRKVKRLIADLSKKRRIKDLPFLCAHSFV